MGGGVGSTQLTTNLAVELAQLEQWDGQPTAGGKPRVAAVDLDFRFGQVAMQLDAQPTYTIAELCETAEQIDNQMIERAMVKHPTGVHVLARPNDMGQAERISAGQCAAALATLQEHYDFVVCDMPARFDATARAVFDMADTHLMVIQLMVPCVRAADRIINELIATGYAMGRIKLVANRQGRESACLDPSDVETTLKRKLDFFLPDEWKSSANAVNMGAPLFLHAPKSKLRLAYQKLAQTLAGNGSGSSSPAESAEPAAPPTPLRKGFFSLFAAARA